MAAINHVEMAVTGTWILVMVRLALEKGYKILEIHEVDEFVTQYKTKSKVGFFVVIKNTFFKN